MYFTTFFLITILLLGIADFLCFICYFIDFDDEVFSTKKLWLTCLTWILKINFIIIVAVVFVFIMFIAGIAATGGVY